MEPKGLEFRDTMQNTDDNQSRFGWPLPPGGESTADRLLRGAVDLHHHGYPEFSFENTYRMDDWDELGLSCAAGIAGVVLKSHMWPTVGRAYHLARMLPSIEVIPSITLNTVVGGFSPAAVESAALQGARVLFMPTWSAANDIENKGFSSLLGRYVSTIVDSIGMGGLRATGHDGKLLPEVRECLSVALEQGMLVCTAHLSPAESLALASAAVDMGIREIVFSHPDSKSVNASREQIRDMAELGACCEFCILGMLPAYQRTSVRSILEVLEDLTADKVVITTDYYGEWSPPGAEMMRMAIGTLLAAGVAETDLQSVFKDNPRRLLASSLRRYPSRLL